jgi:hypothetical protein
MNNLVHILCANSETRMRVQQQYPLLAARLHLDLDLPWHELMLGSLLQPALEHSTPWVVYLLAVGVADQITSDPYGIPDRAPSSQNNSN